ncbi:MULTISPECIES: hypothetical protein [unclassified Microcoleus]|uniref:hypothetical protein n=1 Tax=unclassified Microcoleus TaxID=2642155 RepID=UPI002FCF5F42
MELGVRSQEPGEKSQKEEERSVVANMRYSRPLTFGGLNIRLEPDVAEMFPDSEAVNEVLRFLMRITK